MFSIYFLEFLKHVLPTADPAIINLTKQKRVTCQPKLAYNMFKGAAPPPPSWNFIQVFWSFLCQTVKMPKPIGSSSNNPRWLQIKKFGRKKCRHILFLKMHKGIEFLQQTQIFQSLYL